jgi:hypothetical protein
MLGFSAGDLAALATAAVAAVVGQPICLDPSCPAKFYPPLSTRKFTTHRFRPTTHRFKFLPY